MTKIIIAAVVVSVVILLECAMAYTLIPSSADIEARLKEEQAANVETPEKTDMGEPEPDTLGEPEVEKDLGKYYVVVHQPSTNVTLRINFHLVASVLEKNSTSLDDLLKKNQHRLRDQVIFEVRNSDVNDLTDPGLGLIKRKILGKSNELLGAPLLQAVYFSEFSFIEQ